MEQSVNSTRVSLRFRAGDGVEEYLLRTLLRFLVHRCAPALPPCRRACPTPTAGVGGDTACRPGRRACTSPFHPHRLHSPPLHPCSADQLDVVRRVAVPGWDVTFLVTDAHLQRYRRNGLVDFICQVRRRDRTGACPRRLWGRHEACVGPAGEAGERAEQRGRDLEPPAAGRPASRCAPPAPLHIHTVCVRPARRAERHEAVAAVTGAGSGRRLLEAAGGAALERRRRSSSGGRPSGGHGGVTGSCTTTTGCWLAACMHA